MGQTISEKIFSSHVRREVAAGDILFAPIDLMMSNDASFPLVLEALQKIRGYTLKEPQKLVLILDHYCPSPSQEVSRIHEEIKAFARRFGCILYAEGEGVCHQLIPEKGHVRPGHLVIGSDSSILNTASGTSARPRLSSSSTTRRSSPSGRPSGRRSRATAGSVRLRRCAMGDARRTASSGPRTARRG